MKDLKPSAYQQALARRRAQLIMQVRSGLLSVQEAARQLGISRKTYYKWERRALAAMVKTLGHREHGRPRLPVDPEKETHERQTRELQAKLEVLEQTAGRSEEDPKRLRLAVRNGYLNFYRGGQPVVRVGFNRSRNPQARIHNKFVYGDEGKGNSYVLLTAARVPELGTGQLAPYDCITHLDAWISHANAYAGGEKRFVDDVVARNPNVIDLEMGFPAYSPAHGERSAPRKDMVTLEPVRDTWQIVFWEAKLVSDGCARCRGNENPKVCDQLGNYTKWLGYGNNKSLVQKAYQEACRILVGLHRIASSFNPDIGQLGAGIQAVAAVGAALPGIDVKPRLLIDNRQPDNFFTQNGHLEKLRKAGLHVQMVEGNGDMALRARS